MSWRIGIDVGGTFTDVVAHEDSTGDTVVLKTPSTPDDFSRAFSAGVEGVLEKIGGDAEVGMMFHGTTAATNAILEARYAEMGLVVTRGYRDVLEVARQEVPGDMGDITWWIKPPRVVPLELVREIGGRLNYKGDELRPLDEGEIREVAAEFRERGINALAVSLIHSYRNPAHEQRVRELIKSEHPECFVSVSSDVIREYREYERTLGTCLNTGLMPLALLLRRPSRRADAGAGGPGAALHHEVGGRRRARIGARHAADRRVPLGPGRRRDGRCGDLPAAGHPDVLTIDMGGTSADIALIENGTPRILSEGRIDIYDIKVPMVDITAVGAGGGSIAWLQRAQEPPRRAAERGRRRRVRSATARAARSRP